MGSYVGRFAPSPTGHLHRGSLVAAVGSYVRAKGMQGDWLLRMEDLDPLREVEGAADSILRDLEAHGLYWDGELEYQSQRLDHYESALQTLLEKGLAYPCYCSRKFLLRTAEIGEFGIIYPGHCRDGAEPVKDPAIRLRTEDQEICFDDLRIGRYCQQLESQVGDFIVKRSDGYHAYQLAVVVDDHLQGITEVVRGADLLGNTPRQIWLQQLLGYTTVDYLHLPLVMNEQGQKLSKQTHAQALNRKKVAHNLLLALQHLGFVVPEELLSAAADEILAWAIQHHHRLLGADDG